MRGKPVQTRPFYIVLAVVLVVISANLLKGAYVQINSTSRLKELEKEVAGLQAEKAKLLTSIEYKKTEEYVSERARNDFNMVLEGEQAFVVSQSTPTMPEKTRPADVLGRSDTQSDEEQHEEPNWKKWYRLFFD